MEQPKETPAPVPRSLVEDYEELGRGTFNPYERNKIDSNY